MRKIDLEEFYRQHLPYAMMELRNGNYCMVNRYYKLVGHPNGDYEKYEEQPDLVEYKRKKGSVLPKRRQSFHYEPQEDYFYTSHDYNCPWVNIHEYMKYFEAYMKCFTKVPGKK